MTETELFEIERIRLVKTEYEGGHKTLEFQFTNQSTYCMFPDEEVECEITKEEAVKLIDILKAEFDL